MLKAISKDLDDLMVQMTQKDCTELKKLIIETPQAPLLIFAGEEAYSGQYGYESADMAVCKRPIKTMAQLNKILSAA